jgi:hypothetical protein
MSKPNLQYPILDRDPIFKPGWFPMIVRLPRDSRLCSVGIGRELHDGRRVFCSKDNLVIVFGPGDAILFYQEEVHSVEEVDNALARTTIGLSSRIH